MKVDLENIELGHSELTDEVYAGRKNKEKNMWLHKKNVTNDFIGCVISRWKGKRQEVSANGKKYEISVRELN